MLPVTSPTDAGTFFGSVLQSGSIAMTWARVLDSPMNGLVLVNIS